MSLCCPGETERKWQLTPILTSISSKIILLSSIKLQKWYPFTSSNWLVFQSSSHPPLPLPQKAFENKWAETHYSSLLVSMWLSYLTLNPRPWGILCPSPIRFDETARGLQRNTEQSSCWQQEQSLNLSSFPYVGGFCPHRYHLSFHFKSFEFLQRRYLMNRGSWWQF